MPKMTFIEPNGNRVEVDAPLGLSVMEIAQRNDIEIEGACGGSLACSTCHVIVDPVWFGILITVLMEAALITPPIGINLYVVHGIRQRGGKFNDVSVGAIPFLIAMFVLIAMLLGFPEIAKWLPDQFY